MKGESFSSVHNTKNLWNTLKKYNFDWVFVGHLHLTNVSILYDGIVLPAG